MRAFDLLVRGGVPVGLAYERITRCPKDAADRFLAQSYLAGDEEPALMRLITTRRGVLSILSDQYSSARFEARLRILEVLGRAGDREAVALLGKALLRGGEVTPAANALARVACSGADEAILALVRGLPRIEDYDSVVGDALAMALRPGFAALPDRAGEFLLKQLEQETKQTERRRYWLALAFFGRPSLVSRMSELAKEDDYRSLLTALTISPSSLHGELVASLAGSSNRSTRYAALRALVAMEDPQFIPTLLKGIERSSDRKDVIKLLLPAKDWARPVMEAGVTHRDVSAQCRGWLEEVDTQQKTPGTTLVK
jgi:HEAT repeat protein